jgi:hypothetical protein
VVRSILEGAAHPADDPICILIARAFPSVHT